jgi:transposase
MHASSLFRQMLDLKRPWTIECITSSTELKEITLFLKHSRGSSFPCPECGALLPTRDHIPERAWRHLDSGGFRTIVRARIPRVSCLFHGVLQARVPWALPTARYTTAFEKWAIDVLKETDVLGATRLLGISWDEAWHLMERAVTRGRLRKQQTVISRLGVDEKAIAKGHKYITIVTDLDRGTVEYVAKDRRKTSLDEYYRTLSPEQLAGIAAVAMDMWDPFIASTVRHVPDGANKIVFDRFHIMMLMGKAVDNVRRGENRELRAREDTTLTGTRYFWLYAEENLPEQYEERFAELKHSHLKTARAWAIKECLRDLWRYQRRGWGERHWLRWHSWAIRSRLPEVLEVARTLQRHLPNILTYFEHRITNAVSEGLNSKIQAVKKMLVGSEIATISSSRFISTAEA